MSNHFTQPVNPTITWLDRNNVGTPPVTSQTPLVIQRGLFCIIATNSPCPTKVLYRHVENSFSLSLSLALSLPLSLYQHHSDINRKTDTTIATHFTQILPKY